MLSYFEKRIAPPLFTAPLRAHLCVIALYVITHLIAIYWGNE